MGDLMRKTKKELVALLEELSGRAESAGTEQERLLRALEAAAAERDRLAARCDDLSEERLRLARENERLGKERTILGEAHRRKDSEVEDLLKENERLKCALEGAKARLGGLEEARDRARTEEAHRARGYELFKSFVDNDAKRIILVDASYAVRYVNRSAAALLELPDPFAIVGRRIFDFLPYQDALKLKEKIDTAFLKGEREKAKGLCFRNLKGAEFKLKLKVDRVRYEDRPSVRMVIK